MKDRRLKKTSLFLTELTACVLIFSVCASVCVLAFINADRISKQSGKEGVAVLSAQSVAECIKIMGINGLVDEFDAVSNNGVDYNIYLDGDADCVRPEEAEFIINVNLYNDEKLLTANISVTDGEHVLFELSSKSYQIEVGDYS